MAKVNKISEAELSRQVFDWLRAKGVFAWRMPIGPVYHQQMIRGSLRSFWKKSPIKGFPDICGVLRKQHKGRMFAIELKAASGRVTPEQQGWIGDLQVAGAACAVIRCLDDLESFMRQCGEI